MKKEKVSKKKYYSVAEVADMIGVCRATIMNYIRLGTLKPIRLSQRKFMFDIEKLEDFLDKNAERAIKLKKRKKRKRKTTTKKKTL